jgi:hypothetical protein
MTKKIIKNLSEKRPLYHSEADLQFALGWELKNTIQDSEIRFEQPFENQYIDIIYTDNNNKIGIELKYKTSQLEYTFKNEFFKLKEHSAVDLGRFDVIADIGRLEHFVSKDYISKGYMLFVTNCSSYWTNEKIEKLNKTQDIEFRLVNNHFISGRLNWQKGAKEKTYGKNRINGIELKHKYLVNWNDFSILDVSKNRIFKYLLIEVPPQMNNK